MVSDYPERNKDMDVDIYFLTYATLWKVKNTVYINYMIILRALVWCARVHHITS